MTSDVPGAEKFDVFRATDDQSVELRETATRYLAGAAVAPQIRDLRDLALAQWGVRSGQRLLDAGAGLGEVARDLAAFTAPDGEVVALDCADTTLGAAEALHDGSRVAYVAGDVTDLAFPDGDFDGVRSERVMQHLADPDAAVAELARVLRRGGRMCLIDTDWQSLVLDGGAADLFGEARDAMQRMSDRMLPADRAVAGRTLRRRVVQAGLVDVRATPVTLTFTDLDAATLVVPFLRRNPGTAAMVGRQLDAIDPWLNAIAASDADGTLLVALTIWVVTATKA